MVLLLSLLSCELRDPSIDDLVRVEAPPAEGSLRIATVPDREERGRAPIRNADLPQTAATYQDCFGRGDNSRGSRSGNTARKGSGLGSPARPAPSPRPAPPRAPMAPSPMAGADGSAAMPTTAAPPPPPADPPARGEGAAAAPEAEPVEARQQIPAGPEKTRRNREKDANEAPVVPQGKAEVVTEQQAPASVAANRDKKRDASPYDGDDDEAGDVAMEEEAANDEFVPPAPVLDWGATVHLSNDDSMSLASAQRVLYGMTTGTALSLSEIRPHELLNYFSFDTAGPPETQMFSVLGAAEADGDTLTVSMAVHGANQERQPLDLTVLLDRSCSMQGEGRMDYTRRGLNLLTEQLQHGDRLDVVLFSSAVCTPVEGFVVGRDDPADLQEIIDQLSPTGGTDLDAGLSEALRVQRSRDEGETHGRNRRVMLITDALLNSGNVDTHVVSEVGRAFEDDGIRLTGIGVGRDFNDEMLDILTEKGKGAYVYLGSEAVVDRIFGPGFDSLTRTIAHDVRFSIDLPDSLAMERFYGEEASTNPEDVQPINYYADTSQLFLQDLTMRDGRAVRTDPVRMRIEYRDAATGEPGVQELHTTVGALLDGDPHNLRKGLALMSFSDVVMAQAMGADPCSAPLATYRDRASVLSDDAEIAFVNGLVGQTCGVDLSTVVPQGVAFKVRIDADIPIPEVQLSCNGRDHLERLSGSDTIASFSSVTPGTCTVQLQGRMPMTAAVEVPRTGGDLRCVVRGGRLSCS